LTARLPVITLRVEHFDSGVWGGPHWLTVAGAAAGWREMNSRGTAFPFHPPRGIRGGHLRTGILPPLADLLGGRARSPIAPIAANAAPGATLL
jgi:hypothetical protein